MESNSGSGVLITTYDLDPSWSNLKFRRVILHDAPPGKGPLDKYFFVFT